MQRDSSRLSFRCRPSTSSFALIINASSIGPTLYSDPGPSPALPSSRLLCPDILGCAAAPVKVNDDIGLRGRRAEGTNPPAPTPWTWPAGRRERHLKAALKGLATGWVGTGGKAGGRWSRSTGRESSRVIRQRRTSRGGAGALGAQCFTRTRGAPPLPALRSDARTRDRARALFQPRRVRPASRSVPWSGTTARRPWGDQWINRGHVHRRSRCDAGLRHGLLANGRAHQRPPSDSAAAVWSSAGLGSLRREFRPDFVASTPEDRHDVVAQKGIDNRRRWKAVLVV